MISSSGNSTIAANRMVVRRLCRDVADGPDFGGRKTAGANCRSVTFARSSGPEIFLRGNNFLNRVKMLLPPAVQLLVRHGLHEQLKRRTAFSGARSHRPCCRSAAARRSRIWTDVCGRRRSLFQRSGCSAESRRTFVWFPALCRDAATKSTKRFNDFLNFGDAFACLLRLQIQRRQKPDNLRSGGNHQHAGLLSSGSSFELASACRWRRAQEFFPFPRIGVRA